MNRLVSIGLISVLLLTGVYCLNEGFNSQPAGGMTTTSQVAYSVPEGTLAFSFDHQSGAVYQFNNTAHGSVDFSFLVAMTAQQSHSTSMVDVEMASHGLLYLKFFELSPNRWNVAAQIAELDYQVNQSDNRFIDEIKRPFSFEINSLGQLDHFAYSKGLADESIGFIKQLMLNFQVNLPEQKAASWTTEETDATGQFVASYHFTDADKASLQLHKQNLEYLSNEIANSAIGPEIINTQVMVDQSQALYGFNQLSDWITALNKQESIHMDTDGTIWSRMSSELSIEKIVSDVPADFALTFAAFRQQLDTEAVLRARFSKTLPALDDMAAGLDLAGVIDQFFSLQTSSSQQDVSLASAFLVNYLRKNKQASGQLIALLDGDVNQTLDEQAHLVLWYAVAQAGHVDAQKAMFAAASGEQYQAVTRIRALSYLHDFEYPEPVLVDSLIEHVVNTGPINNDFDQEVAAMSLYALGAMGAKDKLNDGVKQKIRETLVIQLDLAPDGQSKATVLAAIGNNGSEDLLPYLQPYLTGTDTLLQQEAYSSLRNMPGDAAFDAFVAAYEGETAAAVRGHALKVFSKLAGSQTQLDWTKAQLLNTNNANEQLAYVHVLGNSLASDQDNLVLLQQLVKQAGVSTTVRKAAYNYILAL
ncbi:MAG: hypothetical protein ACI8WB_005680 [Phenylobacterium sp.]|jgi:hypothetical protein